MAKKFFVLPVVVLIFLPLLLLAEEDLLRPLPRGKGFSIESKGEVSSWWLGVCHVLVVAGLGLGWLASETKEKRGGRRSSPPSSSVDEDATACDIIW